MYICFRITIYFNMGRNKQQEKSKRSAKYSFEIDLLVMGLPISDVYQLSTTSPEGNKLSRRTIERLKKEYTSFPCDR